MEQAQTIPQTIVVGDDALALRVCEELAVDRTQRITMIAPPEFKMGDHVRRSGAAFVAGDPDDSYVLQSAGVEHAGTILALSKDDGLNVSVALRARDLNPNIRIVLRQFSRTLGQKIEQNLKDCSVLSQASYSAATYAAAAADESCFYGVQFPYIDGALLGFSRKRALKIAEGPHTVRELEELASARVISVDGELARDPSRIVEETSSVVLAGEVAARQRAAKRATSVFAIPSIGSLIGRFRRRIMSLDPIARSTIVAAIVVMIVGSALMSTLGHIDLFTALYFVTETMTTTGFGDIQPRQYGDVAEGVAMLLMIAGVILSGIFIAVISANFTQARWNAIQGLRPIHRRGHIIVCGAGRVGSRVIEFLQHLDVAVVVIEAHPTSEIVELSRDRKIDLLTGDATNDTTLDLCNLEQAAALVALTDSDTMNLEVGLGARARNAELPIVLRVGESAFAQSVERHFGFSATYAAAGLAAPAFAGLARSVADRGRISIDHKRYRIVEFHASADRVLMPDDAFPLSTAGDLVLALVPER